jgi:hypothetical protein
MPEPAIYPVEIDGRGFLVDTSQASNGAFRRTSVQLLNTQQNIDKGESALTPPEVWRRTYQSWHHGEGQKFADRDDADPFRYTKGRGVDPWEKWQLSLLHDTKVVEDTVTELTSTVEGHVVGDNNLILIDDTRTNAIHVTVPPTGDPVHVATVPLGGVTHGASIGSDQVMLIRDDFEIFRIVVSAGTMYVDQIGSLATPAANLGTVQAVGFHNGFLLCAFSTGHVYNIDGYFAAADFSNVPIGGPGGTGAVAKTEVTEVAGNFQPVAFTSGLNSIYLGGNYGNNGVVLRFTISSETAALTFGGTAAELPTEERIAGLGSYLGYVAIGTGNGFRLAASSDQGLTYGPLIETPGAVHHFETGGRFLYFTMSNAWREDEPRVGLDTAFNNNFDSAFDNPAVTVNASGLGRADLSEFVTDLQPAYAHDLLTPIDTQFLGEVAWVYRVNGRLLFGTDGAGVFVETDTYVPFGYIDLSAWTFNVTDPKIGLYTQVRTRPGTRGQGGLFYQTDEDQSTLRMLIPDTSFPVVEDTPLIRYDLSGSEFGSIRLQGIIEPPKMPVENLTSTPVLLGVELRATYQRGMASEWQVPCMLRDEVETDTGSVEVRDVVDDYLHLIRLVQEGRIFTYAEGFREWQVYATDFAWVPSGRSAYNGWQGTFTLVFREIK